MTRLIWDQIGERKFENGLDRGVLYLADIPGVVWNGLTSIEEKLSDGSRPYFLDGVKYLDSEILDDFAASLKAFTYPDEFEEVCGSVPTESGLVINDQRPKSFGLSYRTRVGNDLEGEDYGYKIHILYNLVAVSDLTAFISLSNPVTPIEFGWNIFGTPVAYEGFRPTAHIILDTTELDPFLVDTLEDMLYGTDETDPELPPLSVLGPIIEEWNLLIQIVDHGDGTWSAIGPDALIDMIDTDTFQIIEANAIYLDAVTYEISDTEG